MCVKFRGVIIGGFCHFIVISPKKRDDIKCCKVLIFIDFTIVESCVQKCVMSQSVSIKDNFGALDPKSE